MNIGANQATTKYTDVGQVLIGLNVAAGATAGNQSICLGAVAGESATIDENAILIGGGVGRGSGIGARAMLLGAGAGAQTTIAPDSFYTIKNLAPVTVGGTLLAYTPDGQIGPYRAFPQLQTARQRFEDSTTGALPETTTNNFVSYPVPMKITFNMVHDGVVSFSYNTIHQITIDVADKATEMNVGFGNLLYVDGVPQWTGLSGSGGRGYYVPQLSNTATTTANLSAGTHTLELMYNLEINDRATTFKIPYWFGNLHATWMD